MSAIRQHLEFAPPATPGLVRAVLLALMAHLVLVAFLAIGVAWKRETPPVAVEAELWASVPQEAAPVPPEPEPETPQPEPAPPLPVPPAPPPAPPVVDAPKAADIALAKEKEKEKIRLQKDKELQLAKLEQERKAQQDKLKREKLAQEKQRKEQETKAAREKAEKTEKADKAKAEALAKQKATKAAELAAQKNRDDQLKRMAALAGGETSGTGGAGAAAKSAGPSASYNARVAGRIKPNVTYTDIIVGNPKTEVTVTLSAGGDILSSRITKSSGNKSWDNAALNAIDKTAKLPLDDGKVWSPMIIELSPQNLLGQ
jgi:colicin import membrane protein